MLRAFVFRILFSSLLVEVPRPSLCERLVACARPLESGSNAGGREVIYVGMQVYGVKKREGEGRCVGGFGVGGILLATYFCRVSTMSTWMLVSYAIMRV